jgi:hypothetical protein
VCVCVCRCISPRSESWPPRAFTCTVDVCEGGIAQTDTLCRHSADPDPDPDPEPDPSAAPTPSPYRRALRAYFSVLCPCLFLVCSIATVAERLGGVPAVPKFSRTRRRKGVREQVLIDVQTDRQKDRQTDRRTTRRQTKVTLSGVTHCCNRPISYLVCQLLVSASNEGLLPFADAACAVSICACRWQTWPRLCRYTGDCPIQSLHHMHFTRALALAGVGHLIRVIRVIRVIR